MWLIIGLSWKIRELCEFLVFFKINICSAPYIETSRQELLIIILKNFRNTQYSALFCYLKQVKNPHKTDVALWSCCRRGRLRCTEANIRSGDFKLCQVPYIFHSAQFGRERLTKEIDIMRHLKWTVDWWGMSQRMIIGDVARACPEWNFATCKEANLDKMVHWEQRCWHS